MLRSSSARLARVAVVSMLLAAAGAGLAPAAHAAPVLQTHPTLSGVVAVGATVTCVPGQWTGNGPLTTSYRWVLDGRGPDPYVGNGLTYEPVAADEGWPLQCEETVTDADDTSAQNTQAQVVLGPQALSNATSPFYRGGGNVGETMTCHPGTWSRTATFTYEWLRGGTPIPGATTDTYVLTTDDVGDAGVSCRVTATAVVGGQTATASTSVAFIPKPPPPPRVIDQPGKPTGIGDFPVFERAPLERYLATGATAKIVPGVLDWRSAAVVAPPGDVRVNGIEMTQATQYRLQAFTGAGLPNRCDGDPIPWVASICPAGQPVRYAGVKLVAGRPVVARVFIDRAGARRQSSVSVRITIRTSAGTLIGGLVQSVPLKTSVPAGTARLVTDAQRREAKASVNFTIPGNYIREGSATYEAEVVPTEEGCPTGNCTANNRFVLVGVPAIDTGTLRVGTLQVRFDPAPPEGFRVESNEATTAAFDKDWLGGARAVLPVRAIEVREQAAAVTVDTRVCDAILASGGVLGTLARADRGFLAVCRAGLGWAAVGNVAARAPGWIGGIRRYDTLLGIAQSKNTYSRGTGTERPNLTTVPFGAATGPVVLSELKRPLRTIAHELGHNTGLHHAGQDCEGSDGEVWDPDGRGRLQGVGWDAGQVRYDAPGGDPSDTLYDLMSYCGTGKDDDVWVSPKNWDRMVDAFVKLRDRAQVSGLRLGRRAQADARPTGDHLLVTALAAGGAAEVDRVSIGPARAMTGEPTGYAVRALDAGGTVLAQADAVALPSAESAPGPVAFLQAQLPPAGAGAVRVEVVARDGGAVAGTQSRPAALPPVTVLAPKVARRSGAVAVRWRARQAKSAEVLVSVDNGKTWQLAWSGPAGSGRVLLPGAQVPRSPRAKVRVKVSDGWNVRSDDSPAFASVGAPPRLTLAQPTGPLTIQQGEAVALQASAVDDGGRTLTKGAITWLDGGRRVATGESAAATGLKPGRHAFEVVARDRFGRTASAKFSVRVKAAAPTFTALVVPPTAPAGARTVRVRVAASRAAELRVAGQRFAVGTKAKFVSVRLPQGGAGEIVLGLALRADGRTSRVEAAVTRG